MPQRPAWTWGRSGSSLDTQEERRIFGAYLNDRMADLESYLRELHREVTYGPIPGAYVEIGLGRSMNTGTALPTGTADLSPLTGEARPIAVTLICFFGDLTADLLSNGSSILSAGPVVLTAATPVTLNARGDFNTEKVDTDLALSIVSIDGGTTPEHVRVRVWLKNVAKIEPA